VPSDKRSPLSGTDFRPRSKHGGGKNLPKNPRFQGSYSPVSYRTLRQEQPQRELPFRYRTPRQRNTVPCNKRLPYRPTNARSSVIPPARGQANQAKISCKSGILTVLGSPYVDTVPSGKGYRTPGQTLPYPLARDTVLSNKPYRIARQVLPYSATKLGVPSHKGEQQYPCKAREIGRQTIRAPCICFVLYVFVLFKDGDIR